MRALPSFRGARARQLRRAPACSASTTWSGASVSPPKDGMKHFLHIDDFTADELRAMLRNAAVAKSAFRNRDITFKPFQDWTMAMIFTKPSARTRVSFETVRRCFHHAARLRNSRVCALRQRC
jgi:ornithine carbamoyltransferase